MALEHPGARLGVLKKMTNLCIPMLMHYWVLIKAGRKEKLIMNVNSVSREPFEQSKLRESWNSMENGMDLFPYNPSHQQESLYLQIMTHCHSAIGCARKKPYLREQQCGSVIDTTVYISYRCL